MKDQTNVKPETHPNFDDEIRGEEAERSMFDALQKYFTEDDVLILSSHMFLNEKNDSHEKDFIIVNLSKGYIMTVEVKGNSKRFQKAKKQFFDSKDRLAEVFSKLSLSPAWKAVNLFYAQKGEVPFKQKCKCPQDKCTKYTIIGEDTIADKISLIEQEIFQVNKDCNTKDHLSEFIELFKQLVFIAQGNPYVVVNVKSGLE